MKLWILRDSPAGKTMSESMSAVRGHNQHDDMMCAALYILVLTSCKVSNNDAKGGVFHETNTATRPALYDVALIFILQPPLFKRS